MGKDTGTVTIHGKEYKTVASRVNEFRNEYKQSYSIETEIIDRTETDVVMKATIRELSSGNVVATGHAEEKRADSQINRTSALENAETSAIGRALAAFGLAGTEFASADEVAQAIKEQNAEKWKPSQDAVATDRQKEFIFNLLQQKGIARDDMPEWLADNFGVVGEMSQADASMIIDDLNTKDEQ